MSRELDPQMAKRLAFSAICTLNPPPGNKVPCTRLALREAFLGVAREAYEIGFLAAQREQYGELTRPGSPGRPGWMDIRLDDPEDLAKHHIRITPVVLRSLIGAGCHRLGDLRWVSSRQLRDLHYIGIKTARDVLAIVHRFETDEEAPTGCLGPRHNDSAGTGS
jgi:hypothetical protein